MRVRPSVLRHACSRQLSTALNCKYPTVGVAVTIFPRLRGSNIIDTGRILLIQRGREPGKGLWCFPGGRQELGETIAEAAIREGKEETGLDLQVHNPFVPGYAATDVLDYNGTAELRYHYGIVHVLSFCDAHLDAQGRIVLPHGISGDDADNASWVSSGVECVPASPFGAAPTLSLQQLVPGTSIIKFVPEVINLAISFVRQNIPPQPTSTQTLA